MKQTAVLACIALAGCQSMLGSSIPTGEEAFHALNSRFAGRSVEEVLVRYGLPNQQTTYRGMTILLWKTEATMQFREPVTTTTAGRIGDLTQSPWASVPYTETTASTQYVSQNLRCMMRVGVREDMTVDGIDLVGKMGACQHFMP